MNNCLILFACSLLLLISSTWSNPSHSIHEVEIGNNSNHHHHEHRHKHYQGMTLYGLENAIQEKKAYDQLVSSLDQLNAGKELPQKTPFDDILPSILLSSTSVARDKFIVASNAIQATGKNYIVYAAGIANDPSFEGAMFWQLGADVYGFDCTVPRGKPNWGFHFYSICIGDVKGLKESSYARQVVDKNLTFMTLPALKEKFQHRHIDMLKMDIEGCEWDLLYQEIVHSRDEDLPTQLLFELHTEGANRRWVPETIVAGKKRKEVNQLILDLYKRNYRVFHLELNDGDQYCAEISLYRI